MNTEIDEELRLLDHRLKQLKLDYEQYFLGSRPREPVQLRSELQKVVTILLNTSIQNTAQRFKFNSINSRFQTFKRQWNETQRQIENVEVVPLADYNAGLIELHAGLPWESPAPGQSRPENRARPR